MKQTIFSTIASVVESGDVPAPFFAFRPSVLKRAVQCFSRQFNGQLLYAVKTNPELYVINQLYDEGIRTFDVASLEEVRTIYEAVPGATLFFMHPVKSRQAIHKAYHEYGVRRFSLDSIQELQKILEETNHATDLHLFVRLAIPNSYSELNLGEKFGATMQEAPALLAKARAHAKGLGICFHVGSQCMHPDAYRIAMRMAGKVIKQSGVMLEYFNVGGGFPSIYPGMIPVPLTDYFEAIHDEFAQINKGRNMQLLAEPGRALVAESTSVIVRVDLRKGNTLYINDGTYGSLFDAGLLKFIFPVRIIRPGTSSDESADLVPFSFYGPTCDTLDFMKGPFYLPECIGEGDHIEIGQLGAYGRTLATRFNGFSHHPEVITVSDEPLMTMYDEAHISERPLEIIAA